MKLGHLGLQWSGCVTTLPLRLPVSVWARACAGASSAVSTCSSICCHLDHLPLNVMEKRRDLNVKSFYLFCESAYYMLMTLDLSVGHHSLRSCSGDHSSGGLHKGSEIWEAVQRSERMLRHRGQLRRKKSAMITYKKGKEKIPGEIYLHTLLIDTRQEWEAFSPSSSADSCSLPVLEAGSS